MNCEKCEKCGYIHTGGTICPTPQASSAVDGSNSWIAVSKQLPENNSFVLVWGSHVMPWMAEYRLDHFHDIEDGDILCGITHWMPLPKPPVS